MRTIDSPRPVLVLAVMMLCTASAGCTNQTAPGPYISASWTMSCDSGCPTFAPHDVMGYTGTNGISFTCAVQQTGTTGRLSFSVIGAGDYLRISNAEFDMSSGTMGGGSCALTVEEEQRYEGSCSGAPCTITGATFGRDDRGRSRIEASFTCDDITPIDSLIPRRNLGGTFIVYDCPGFQPN